jgi:hypothetical protein
MNYMNEECADTRLILGEERGSSAEADQLYAERLPNHQTPSRSYQTNELCFIHLSLCVMPVILKRQRPLLQNGDVALVHELKTELRCCSSNYL